MYNLLKMAILTTLGRGFRLALLVLSASLAFLGLAAPQPQLLTEPDPPSCDLGQVEEGAIVVWYFRVKNGGDSLLEWQAHADQLWISLEPERGSLEASATLEVRVTVDTGGLEPGEHRGRIVIDSNGGRKVGSVRVEVLPRRGLAPSPWPAFHHDPQRTGKGLLRGPEQPEVRWFAETSGPIWSSPVIGLDGTVYVTTLDGWLYAFSPKGRERWRLELGGIIAASPAIAADGTIYVGNNRYLYAIAPEGKIRWKGYLGQLTSTSPMIAPDGTVYVGGEGLFAFGPNGRLKWEFAEEGYIDNSAPAVAPDGTIYVGFSSARGSKLVALNSDGTERWEFAVEAPISSTPAIGPDGTVYFLTRGGWLYAVGREGRLRWKRYVAVFPHTALLSSPAIGNGTVYIGSDDYALYALSFEGRERWHFTTKAPIHSSPAIDAAGVIYFGSDDGNLYALTPDGRLKWRCPLGGPVLSSPAIGNGMIYIGSNDHRLYAIGNPRGVAIFQFRNLIVTPQEVFPEEAVQARAEVLNCGDRPGGVTAELIVDGEVWARQDFYLEPGEVALASFTFAFSPDELGEHQVTIDGLPPVTVVVTEG